MIKKHPENELRRIIYLNSFEEGQMCESNLEFIKDNEKLLMIDNHLIEYKQKINTLKNYRFNKRTRR